ncbi:MAG: hypothetical protein AB4372_10595 [Xenococcus sp. (in: cyanobacteria)]
MPTKSRKKVTDKTLKQQVENIKKQNESLENSSEYASRIRDLCVKINEMPGFSLSEFCRITKVGDQTFRSWRDNGVDNPHASNLEAIRRYLRVKESAFSDYLQGGISLDQLWSLRNSDLGSAATCEELISIFKLLDFEAKLKVLARLPGIVEEEYSQKDEKAVYLSLSDKAQIRLENLLEMSLKFSSKSISDLLSEGVDGALLENITTKGGKEFTEEVYATLIPFLCVPTQWVGDLPVPDPNRRISDVDALLKELEEK